MRKSKHSVSGFAIQAVETAKESARLLNNYIHKSNLRPTILRKWRDDYDSLLIDAVLPGTTVALLGATGSGKSSLINALLDRPSLLPTSGIRACTSSIIEVHGHKEPEIVGCIDFKTKDVFGKELAAFQNDLLDFNGAPILESDDSLDEDSGSPAWASYCRCHALWPKLSIEQIVQSSAEDLLNMGQVSVLLNTTQRFSSIQQDEFSKKLSSYLGGAEGDQGRETNKELWPLTHKIRIYVNSPVLSMGAVLVDLPGTGDVDVLRSALGQKYIEFYDISRLHEDMKENLHDLQARLRNKAKNRICALHRNTCCRESLQKQFQFGLQDVATRMSKGRKSSGAKRASITGPSVFTVSSYDYMEIEKRSTDIDSLCFSKTAETEIPLLRNHVLKLSSSAYRSVAFNVASALRGLACSITSYIENSAHLARTEDQKIFCAKFGDVYRRLEADQESTITREEDQFENRLMDAIGNSVRDGCSEAAVECAEIIDDFINRTEWKMFRSMMKRDGMGPKEDLTSTLIAPILNQITTVWPATFGRNIHHFENFELTVKDQIATHIRDLNLRAEMSIIQNSKTLSRQFTIDARDSIAPGYSLACGNTGPGSYERNKDALVKFFVRKSNVLFREASSKTTGRLGDDLVPQAIEALGSGLLEFRKESKAALSAIWEKAENVSAVDNAIMHRLSGRANDTNAEAESLLRQLENSTEGDDGFEGDEEEEHSEDDMLVDYV